MNFYAQAIIYEIKIENQQERIEYLENDIEKYVESMRLQQTKEVEAYHDALTLICETAKINQETFMKTYGNEVGGPVMVKNELINQCMSPFTSLRAFTKEQTIEMFARLGGLTIKKLELALEQVPDIEHYDFVIYFDKIITDLAKNHDGVDCIEFWASVCKYDLLSEPLDAGIANIIDQYVKLQS